MTLRRGHSGSETSSSNPCLVEQWLKAGRRAAGSSAHAEAIALSSTSWRRERADTAADRRLAGEARSQVIHVLVYFGYPQAHEDDAERAVRAGLEVIAAVNATKAGTALQTRVGIASEPYRGRPPSGCWSKAIQVRRPCAFFKRIYKRRGMLTLHSTSAVDQASTGVLRVSTVAGRPSRAET
jgi:hypothetical protein